MGLEAATHVDDLVTTNPVVGDVVAQGDDHLRLLKTVLKTTFPFAGKPLRFPTAAAFSSNQTLTATDDNELFYVDSSGGAVTLTLPTLTSGQAGWSVRVVKSDSGSTNAVNITPPSGTINGQASIKLMKQWESVRVEWTGATFTIQATPLPFPYRVLVKTSDDTLSDDEMRCIVVVNAASDPVTITLPAAVDGDWVVVRRHHASNNVVIEGNGSETIAGELTFPFSAQNEMVLIVAYSGAWYIVSHFGGVASAPPFVPPQGYLTLSAVSGEPIIAADRIGITSLFYDVRVGNQLPISTDGVSFRMRTFSRTEIALHSSHSANTHFDVFAADSAGSVVFGTGPAWATNTFGSGARGTGAGTTQLSRLNGLYVNTEAITLRNGGTTYSIAAREATYLGTILIDATQAQLTCHTLYGQARRWSIWNAFNRRPLELIAGDSGPSWNSATSIGMINGDANNEATMVIGLSEEYIDVTYIQAATVEIGESYQHGVGENSTASIVGARGLMTTNNTVISTTIAEARVRPDLGAQKFNMLELASGTVAVAGGENDCRMSVKWMG